MEQNQIEQQEFIFTDEPQIYGPALQVGFEVWLAGATMPCPVIFWCHRCGEIAMERHNDLGTPINEAFRFDCPFCNGINTVLGVNVSWKDERN